MCVHIHTRNSMKLLAVKLKKQRHDIYIEYYEYSQILGTNK